MFKSSLQHTLNAFLLMKQEGVDYFLKCIFYRSIIKVRDTVGRCYHKADVVDTLVEGPQYRLSFTLYRTFSE